MFAVRNSETGNAMNYFETLEEAKERLALYEEEDKANGEYSEGFYEIYNYDIQEIVELIATL